MSLDPQIILQEKVRCVKSPQYYLNNYGYVFDAKKKKIDKMKCFKYQERCIADFHKFQNNIVLKSRQTGLSVVTAGYVAWRLLFRYEEKILIIANQGDGAIRFLETVKQFIENTPEWLMPTSIAKKNQTELEFAKPHGSWVKAKASSPEAGRGESLTMLVLDETAFIKDDEQIWMGAGMALSMTKGKCIMISTPNGTGNLYHKTWVDAIKKDNDFNKLEVHWTENPNSAEGLIIRKDPSGNDVYWSPWYEEQCRRLGYDSVKIAQELDLSFEGSKYLAIENSLIDKYEKTVRHIKPNLYLKYDFLFKGEAKAGTFVIDETGFQIFKRPVEGRSYVIGVDVARGDGKDFSTIQILDVETLEQVAEYRERIGVDLLPYIVDWAGRTYNNAYIVIEANSFGLGVGFDMRDKFHYKRLFYSKNVGDIHVRPSDYKIPEGVEIPGFQTTRKSRPLLVKAIIEHMREGSLIINSQRLLAEMKTFIMKGERPEAQQGFNDDLIFALGLALYIRDTEYNNVSLSNSMYKSMLDSIMVSNSSITGDPDENEINFNNKKIEDNPIHGDGFFVQNNYTQNPESDDDFSWLLK